jgi:hypothetical protein
VRGACREARRSATIPSWARPFVGGPFDPSYIKAAVIHDHYCDRHVRPWRSTHRAFYDALIALGLDTAKAKVMYYAVYLGGPKWVKLIPGKPCGSGIACINNVKIDMRGARSPPGTTSWRATRNTMIRDFPRSSPPSMRSCPRTPPA